MQVCTSVLPSAFIMNLKNTKAKFMLIIKNTGYIYELYKDSGFNIMSFDKKYLVSFMNRNNKNAKHLLITNY